MLDLGIDVRLGKIIFLAFFQPCQYKSSVNNKKPFIILTLAIIWSVLDKNQCWQHNESLSSSKKINRSF